MQNEKPLRRRGLLASDPAEHGSAAAPGRAEKARPRHEPDAKTSYSGTILGFAGSILEVI
jgi:hypothetical protein